MPVAGPELGDRHLDGGQEVPWCGQDVPDILVPAPADRVGVLDPFMGEGRRPQGTCGFGTDSFQSRQ